MQILIFGMHQSGTSMLARLLNMMGAYFGPEGASTGANQQNPKGFWERRDVRRTSDRLLQASGADWDRVGDFSIEKIPQEELQHVQEKIRSIVLELDAHRPWFVKEPRLCLLFPVWRPLLGMPVCVHIYRHPLEVALSLRERNGFSIPLGLALWERYTLAAFAATAGVPRVLVSHAKLLESPVETLQSLAAQLTERGVRGLREPAEAEIKAFVCPELHHHRFPSPSDTGDYLLKNHRELMEMVDSGAILERGPEALPAVSSYSMDLLVVHDAVGGKLREKLVAAEKLLEDRSWRFSRVVAEHKKVIERRDRQIQEQREWVAALQKAIERRDRQIQEDLRQIREQREKASALDRPVERRDRQIQQQRRQSESLQKQLNEAENRWKSDLAKLGKWSDRIAQDLGRLLKSNRWRLGCWLSLKRSGSRSKEAQRFAHLVATRPQPRVLQENRVTVPDGAMNEGQKPRQFVGRSAFEGDAGRRGATKTEIAEPAPAINERQRIASQPAAPAVLRVVPTTSVAVMAKTTKPAAPITERQPASEKPPVPGKADVIVCVHNALEDIRRCLDSIVDHRSARLNKLILVNDGSDAQTASYLRQFVAEAKVETVLLENPQPTGYTKAANRGLVARKAEYVILLNSDTIVTPAWIDRLIACGESDPSIGIIGPLSNAASWQSVPERYSAKGDWAVNELPSSSLDRVSRIFSILHAPQYPRVPLVNGFCFAIKSTVIDTIGLFDEELFPKGYGEENDYCLRTGKAGFSVAIADDCYLFHAKSRSYSHESRRKLARQSQLILRQKYGADLDKATDVLKNSPELARARSVFARLLDALPCSILFLMKTRAAGGGVNSIVQEADGLRKLGAAVQVAIRSQDESYYRERFRGVAPNLFHVSRSAPELINYARSFEFVVATLYKSVRTLKTLLEQSPGVVPCYYIQDYEANFFHSSDADYREAVESYTLIPEMRCFAKTRWLCEMVTEKHGVPVHKVEPSIDRVIFFSDDRPKPGTPFVVCAMVRPTSERRSPGLTFEILRRIKQEFGESVEIRMFGLEQDDPYLDHQPSDFEYKVLGILDRQGVANLMRESSLFIDASPYQAFGRTGLEAMACRCATILPSEGGISEYAVDGVNTLLAAPNDAGDVLRKVRRYIEEPQLYQSIVEQGLKTASRYSIERACASELEFFESLRQEPRPRAPVAERVASQHHSHRFITHPETWMGRDELGRARPYRPTIIGFDHFINDQHRYYHECPTKGILIDVGIQGKLRREDALKLYEMAYYATGDILEFGTNRGLSTSILARAITDAGKSSELVTMELDERLAEHARRSLSGLDLSRRVEFMVGDADASCQKLVDAGRKFHFAFIDHSHAYDHVVKACRRLSQLLVPGSFCLFHDYNTSREGTAEYGVYTAVAHALDESHFEFCGVYGCCGLFRKREANNHISV
jgi:GT2 family glycosyltransferase/predicted O-methyltransferase YrrM/glycosyltransferase involved in cell wall biosynthesis